MTEEITSTKSRQLQFITLLSYIFPLLYPMIVFWFSDVINPNIIAVLFLLIMFFRIAKTLKLENKKNKYTAGCLIIAIVCVFLFDSNRFAYFYPVLMNFYIFLTFYLSLKFPPTVIAYFATLQGEILNDTGKRYTQKITYLWVILSGFNTLCSFITVILDNKVYWAIFNGGVSYILIGLLFSLEIVYRKIFLLKTTGK